MIATVATGLLVITFTDSISSIILGIFGAKTRSEALVESSRRASLITFPLLSMVMISLIFLLATGRFEYAYVFQTTDANMPFVLKIAALWGGQEGSLLLWCWLLSGFSFISLANKRKADQELTPWVIVVTSLTLVFFLFLVIFYENPFLRFFYDYKGEVIKSLFGPPGSIAAMPEYGLGMNPLLRHPGMVFHPPMLYLGFVGYVIPYAYAIAALIKGRLDDHWIRKTHVWSLSAWLFLTLGLVLGSRWSYDVLGWGGYWGWDPVEISALIPWLTGTAFLHSSMVQEKREGFKRWSVALIILTFCLVIVGTFFTRSGLLSSVHAFSQSTIGFAYLVFTAFMLIGSLILMGYRWDSLKSELQISSYFSRESLFIFNNLIFIAIFLICLVGILFPIFSELATGQQVTVGPPFYRRATGPLFAALLLLMGIVPLSAWSTSTGKRLGRNLLIPGLLSLAVPAIALLQGARDLGAILALWIIFFSIIVTIYDFIRSIVVYARLNRYPFFHSFQYMMSRNRRRYGAYAVHLGIAMMGIGIIGFEFFQTQTQMTVKKDEAIIFAGYSLIYHDLKIDNLSTDREIARAEIHVLRNEQELTWLYPTRTYYYTAQQNVTTPGLRSTLLDDLYIILVDWMPITSDGATFKIYHNPLVIWLWIGSGVLAIGTLFSLWPVHAKADPGANP
jgi:cytochrome c-type biogenesis protein CcmF